MKLLLGVYEPPGWRLDQYVRVAYECEVNVRPHGTSRVIQLGARQTDSPRLALRWMRAQAERLSRALSPSPHDSPYPVDALQEIDTTTPDPGEQLGQWALDRSAHETQLHLLRCGELASVTATDAESVYALTARQVWVPIGPVP